MNEGEVHAIMGKNGSGKSTLSQVLMGKESYEVTEGSVTYKSQDLLELSTEDAGVFQGMFIAFQGPRRNRPASPRATSSARPSTRRVKAPGQARARSAAEFLKMVRQKMTPSDRTGHLSFMQRGYVIRGLCDSAVEKKRSTRSSRCSSATPPSAIMDETDSGLDIDVAQDTVAEDGQRPGDDEQSFAMLVAFYCTDQRLHELQSMPDYVHRHARPAGSFKSGRGFSELAADRRGQT